MKLFLLMLWFAPFWVVYRCIDVALEGSVVRYPLATMSTEPVPTFLRVFCPGSAWALVFLGLIRWL